MGADTMGAEAPTSAAGDGTTLPLELARVNGPIVIAVLGNAAAGKSSFVESFCTGKKLSEMTEKPATVRDVPPVLTACTA